jgi:hypothetical protein
MVTGRCVVDGLVVPVNLPPQQVLAPLNHSNFVTSNIYFASVEI